MLYIYIYIFYKCTQQLSLNISFGIGETFVSVNIHAKVVFITFRNPTIFFHANSCNVCENCPKLRHTGGISSCRCWVCLKLPPLTRSDGALEIPWDGEIVLQEGATIYEIGKTPGELRGFCSDHELLVEKRRVTQIVFVKKRFICLCSKSSGCWGPNVHFRMTLS